MPEWLKDWGTLAIAVYGAVTATIGLGINWLNRRDTRRETERARLAEAPYARLAVTNGDEIGRMVHATFWNPSPHEVQIEEVEVLKPRGWRVIPFNRVAGNSISLEETGAGRRVPISIKIGLPPHDPSKPVIGQGLIVAAPKWSKEFMGQWPGGVKHVPAVAIEIVFRGREHSASRAVVEISASA